VTVRYLQIEPTTRCNFTCGFCCGRSMPQEDLAWSTFEASLATFPDLAHVELQGEGESLLHPEFFRMAEALRDRGVRVSIITNGSLLHPSIADRLLDAGLSKISVSLESADPETFRKIRGGKLEKVVANLERLLAARRERGAATPVVGLSVTVLRSTEAHRQAIYDLYERLGLDGGITLQPLQEMESYARHYGADVAAEELDARAADRVLARFFSDPALRRITAARPPIRGFYEEMSEGWSAGSRRCPYLDAGMYVHRDGAVTACCMIKDTGRHALGRIGETDAAALVAGRAALAAELAQGVIPAPCQGCTLARFAVAGRGELVAFGLRGLWDRLTGA
jgi:MoaA/NifB/PqqE/SkfB family radical SAM enzyme